MFLASLLSFFTGAWLLAAAPFTVTMKPAGYSARSDGETVTVSQVVKGGIADKAGLQTGMTLLRIDMPFRRFTSRTPLPQLTEDELLDALTPQPGELLQLGVASKDPRKKGPWTVLLQNQEPFPDNLFPVVPLPKERMDRLTLHQMNHYFARLAQAAEAEKNKPTLEAEQEASAYVVKGRLEGMMGGGFTPLQAHARLILKANCHSPLEKVELSGGAGFQARTLRPDSAIQTYQRFVVDLPLWSVRDVVQGCASPQPPFERGLNVSMSCQGKPVLKRDVAVKLTVHCEEALPGAVTYGRQVVHLAAPWEFLVGDTTPLSARVSIDKLIPRPAEATLVELDAAGKVLRRHASLPTDAHDQEFKVTLDTKEARTARLAVEVRFADGSNWVSAPETREVLTQEQVDARIREVREARAKLDAFEKHFFEKFDDPCKDLPATMEWLQAQTDLEYASAEKDGHSFSYKVKGALAPLAFSCHSWK
ncbi:PDZ domain-containing protein [Corallococcus sp. bb12-1]|uniref:PDZ domain-containing protein n=1 Tax=Corallococcus sp. bb12-1 TaxID=2996784 RepID=UPI0022712AF6|nr:PDZ domain-containing protein [Corallococcus sp. bb12-1]MCY1039696.1 PDZ domain-containing protein [Corallococcus sp. bb12-1]